MLIEIQKDQVWKNNEDEEVLVTDVLEPRESRDPRGIDVTWTATGIMEVFDEPEFRRSFQYLRWAQAG